MKASIIEWNKTKDSLPPYKEKVMLYMAGTDRSTNITIGHLESTDEHGNHFFYVGQNLSQAGVEILTTNKFATMWAKLPKL